MQILDVGKISGKWVWTFTGLAKSAIERKRAVEFKRWKGMVYGGHLVEGQYTKYGWGGGIRGRGAGEMGVDRLRWQWLRK